MFGRLLIFYIHLCFFHQCWLLWADKSDINLDKRKIKFIQRYLSYKQIVTFVEYSGCEFSYWWHHFNVALKMSLHLIIDNFSPLKRRMVNSDIIMSLQTNNIMLEHIVHDFWMKSKYSNVTRKQSDM